MKKKAQNWTIKAPLPKAKPPETSWWLTTTREEFNAAHRREVPRMVGQAGKLPDKADE